MKKPVQRLFAAVLSALLIITFIPLTAFSVFAESEVIITYEAVNGNATVTGLTDKNYSGDITIPSTIGGLKVTSIGQYAFFEYPELKNVNIPKSVTAIYDGAFYHCQALESVAIPNSVTSIGASAFHTCSNLKSIKLPNSVTSIGDFAFYGCSAITSITIPNSVVSIGKGAFHFCPEIKKIAVPASVTSIGEYALSTGTKLESITVDSGNKAYYSDGNCLIRKDSKTLIAGCKNSIIPNKKTVTAIGVGAFRYCEGLTSVTIPDSVTSIGAEAFFGCSNLQSIIIPNSVTSIGDCAFYCCLGLTSITLPVSVTSIGKNAFLDCLRLKDVYYTGTKAQKDKMKIEIDGDKDILLKANWYNECDKIYSINYKLKGGENNSNNPKNYTVKSENVKFEAPTKAGYSFKGWYADAEFKTKVTAIKKGSTGNKTLYAKWEKITYKITYKLRGGKNNAKNPNNYTVTSTVTLKSPTRKGYTFKGWFSDSKLEKIEKGSTGNKTLYAKWEKDKYTITYKLNKGKNNSKNPKKYTVTSSDITLKAPTRKGYKFKGWYADSEFKKKVKKIAKGSTGNKTLYAKWEKVTYKITYKLNKGKNNSKNPKKYTVTSSTIKLKKPTRKGYKFKGWYADSKFKKKITKIKKGTTGNKTLYAKW